MHALQTRLTPLFDFARRYPTALALVSFLSGVASFFLVNRQHRSGGVLALILLLSWLWLMLENLLSKKVARRFGLEIPPRLLRFLTQMIHQESLFFVLPFFLVTTTWNSGQALFTGVLSTAAVVSVIDPLYYRWLAANPLVYSVFHTLTLFAVLLTALPVLLQLTTTQTYIYATVATLLLAFATLLRLFPPEKRWRRLPVMAVLILAVGSGLWLARFWVPPATLWLTNVYVSTDVNSDNHTPGLPLKSVDQKQLQDGLYAYTAIRAPRGLQEQVFHVWRHNGHVVDRIPLQIQGGREQGYRTWTHKTNFPPHSAGDWQVQVVTADGQLIGVVRFKVTDTETQTPVASSNTGTGV